MLSVSTVIEVVSASFEMVLAKRYLHALFPSEVSLFASSAAASTTFLVPQQILPAKQKARP